LPEVLLLWLETSSSHAVYVYEIPLLLLPAARYLRNSLLVRLVDTPFDRCPAGLAYLAGLLLR
jgi:hypothetical protein